MPAAGHSNEVREAIGDGVEGRGRGGEVAICVLCLTLHHVARLDQIVPLRLECLCVGNVTNDDADFDVAIVTAPREVGGRDEHLRTINDDAFSVKAREGLLVSRAWIEIDRQVRIKGPKDIPEELEDGGREL